MLSSLNAYNGLSAAELLKLFGANSSSSPSASSSASTAQPASSSVSASSASDPANAIKAILAQAQIAQQAQTAASQGGSASSTAVASAYAAETGTSGDQSAASATAETAYAVQMGDTAPILGTSVTMSKQDTGQLAGVSYSTSFSITSVPSASASEATSDPQTDDTDYFQLDLTIGNDSIAVGFTIAGLGQVGTATTGIGLSVGQGNAWDLLQITASTNGSQTAEGIDFAISGVDAAQSQEISAAFEKATSSPNETRIENAGSSFQYDENLGPGFSATVSADVGT